VGNGVCCIIKIQMLKYMLSNGYFYIVYSADLLFIHFLCPMEPEQTFAIKQRFMGPTSLAQPSIDMSSRIY